MDNEEPTILQYARQHGLATDFLAIDAFALLPRFSNDEDLLSDPDLPPWEPLDLTGPEFVEPEKLQVHQQVFKFITSVLKLGAENPVDRRRRLEGLRLELPLLRTDPDSELFGRGFDFGVEEGTGTLPVWTQPAACDEELWQQFDDAAQDWVGDSGSEEVLMEEKTKSYLEAIFKCLEVETGVELIEEVATRSSSPLLLALFDDLVLEDDMGEMLAGDTALPSEDHDNAAVFPSSSPILGCRSKYFSSKGKKTTAAVRTPVRTASSIILHHDDTSPLTGPSTIHTTGRVNPTKSEDARSPSRNACGLGMSQQPKLASEISTSPTSLCPAQGIFDTLNQYSPPDLVPETSPLPSQSCLLLGDDFSGAYFEEAFAQLCNGTDTGNEYSEDGNLDTPFEHLLNEARAQIHGKEREQINGAARVQARKVDSPGRKTPDVPYDFEAAHTHSTPRGASEVSTSDLFGPWETSRAEHLQMRWEPFEASAVAAVFKEEEMVDEKALALWLAPVPFASLMHAEASDDQNEDTEMQSELIEYIDLESIGPDPSVPQKRKLDTHLLPVMRKRRGDTSENDVLRTEIGSLGSFLQLKAARRTRLKKAQDPRLQPVLSQSSTDRPSKHPSSSTSVVPIQQVVSIHDNKTTSNAPKISLPEIPGSFVVSTTLLAQRSLSNAIRSLYPLAKWEEVDFSLPKNGPESADPDLLLAPDVALLVTSLTRLHQRPLPGAAGTAAAKGVRSSSAALTSTLVALSPAPSLSSSTSLPSLHARVTRTASRFANVVVLVAQRLLEGSSPVPLSDADEKALEELKTLAGRLVASKLRREPEKPRLRSVDARVRVEFCAGGEKELAEWIVAMMVEYGRPE